jgi:hypothetical protein
MLKKNLLVPLIIYLVFVALYVSISLINGNTLLFQPVWDIGHYQSIAERGYEVRPCDPAVDYPPGDVCGNVGWFPGWPGVLKILSLGQVALGLKILPFVFTLAGFIALYLFMIRIADRKAAAIATIALAATPSAFYYLTGFPYSLLLFLFAAYLYYLYCPTTSGRRWILPGIALILSLTYPSAFLTAVIPMVMILRSYRTDKPRPSVGRLMKDLLYYVGPFALGPLLLSLFFYLKFNDFLLIVHFQEKYHRSWDFPLTVIWDSFLQFPALYVENASVLFYGLILLVFAPYRIRGELVAFFVIFFLFSPSTGSIISVYRHYLLLFPAAMIIGASPRPLWVKVAYIALGLTLALFRFFPIFLNGRLI